jgi:chromosome segregation ATPase
MYRYRWRTRGNIAELEHTIGQLRTTICSLRRELENKEGAVGRLELVLHQRLETIDALRDTIDQLRATNARLDAEAERLCEMVRLS